MGTSVPDDHRKEEFSDWPQSLLAIGTLGNTDLKEEARKPRFSEDSHSSQELDFFYLEEVIKLQEELTELLSRKPNSSIYGSEKGGESCPPNSGVDCRDQDSRENDGDLSPNTRITLSKAKDISAADQRNAISRQKSFSFLLKKKFVCRSGFSTPGAPSLRDQLGETKTEKVGDTQSNITILHTYMFY